MRHWVIKGLRVALAVLPLIWIGSTLDVEALGERWGALELPTFLLAASAPLLAMGIGAVRWRVLLVAYGAQAPPPASTLFRHVLVGAYFNQLPGAVAGDALRAFRTRSALGGVIDSLTVVFVERVLGLCGLLLLGALAWAGSEAGDHALAGQALLGGALIASLIVGAVLLGPRLYRRLVTRPARSRLSKVIDGWLSRVPPPRSGRGLLMALLLSLLTQGTIALQALLLLADLAPDVSGWSLFPLLPLVIFLTYFPITPAGVGQRELVFVELLSTVGVSPEAALTCSLLVFSSLLLAAGIGGLLHFFEGPERRDTLPPPGAPSWPPPR